MFAGARFCSILRTTRPKPPTLHNFVDLRTRGLAFRVCLPFCLIHGTRARRTSTDRNDGSETFLLFSEQSRSITHKGLEEISAECGVEAAVAVDLMRAMSAPPNPVAGGPRPPDGVPGLPAPPPAPKAKGDRVGQTWRWWLPMRTTSWSSSSTGSKPPRTHRAWPLPSGLSASAFWGRLFSGFAQVCVLRGWKASSRKSSLVNLSGTPQLALGLPGRSCCSCKPASNWPAPTFRMS